MNGDHSIEVAAAVTQAVWEATIKALHDQYVLFEGILPNLPWSLLDLNGKEQQLHHKTLQQRLSESFNEQSLLPSPASCFCQVVKAKKRLQRILMR